MKGFREFLKEHPIKPLFEMATVCHKTDGFGIVLKVYNRDEHNPPHMHLFDISGKELGKVVLTDETPKTIEDLVFDKGIKPLSTKIKTAIVKWGNMPNRKNKKINNWESASMIWDIYTKDWE